MKTHVVHAREVAAPPEAVFAELAALGTQDDRIWPVPRMPFRRTPGPLVVGATRERHGMIRATLAAHDPGRHLAWRARQWFLSGTHAFTVTPSGRGSRVEHALDARIAWWFAPVWRRRIAALHNRISCALLERLAEVFEPATSRGTSSSRTG